MLKNQGNPRKKFRKEPNRHQQTLRAALPEEKDKVKRARPIKYQEIGLLTIIRPDTCTSNLC
jgi:hypothetical protein